MPEPMADSVDPRAARPTPGPPRPVPPSAPRPGAAEVGAASVGDDDVQRHSPEVTSGEQADDGAPQTWDLVVDAALRDLAGVPADDLDATLTAGESVHATLTARLSDLST